MNGERNGQLRVGFIGLGDQGAPIAHQIVDAGFPTTLYARRPQTLEPFRSTPAAVAATPAELAASSDVVCICVVDDHGVLQVVEGPDGVLSGLPAGGTLVVHSTIGVDTCRHLAAQVDARGGSFLDAAVSNTIAPRDGLSAAQLSAKARAIVVMVGGDEATLRRVEPVFRTFGDPILHLGGVGSGMLAKLINNVLYYSNQVLVHDALAFGERLGLQPGALVEVLRKGSGRSFAVDVTHPVPGSLDLESRTRAMGDAYGALLAKDVRVAVELATREGADLGALGAAAQRSVDVYGRPEPAH